MGNVDAHVTSAAAGALAPGQLVAIMGTSTCHVMNGAELHQVPGMCGVVLGGISAGMYGYEAGQSGVGDIFGHFVDTAVPPSYVDAATARGMSVHEYLTELASAQAVGEHGLLALDWHSGNRSVLVDHSCPASSSARRSRPGRRTSTARCSKPPHSAPARSSRPSTPPASRCTSSWSPAACSGTGC